MIAPLTTTIQGWLDTYLAERDVKPSTARAYRCAVKRFVDFAGPTSIDAAAGKLNDFIRFRCDGGSRHTAHFYRLALLAIIRAAHDADLCELPKRIRPVKLAAHEPVGFSTEEIKRLIAHATPLQRAAIMLVWDTGIRRGDVFRTKWANIYNGNRLRIVVGKNGKRHSAMIRPETLAACSAVQDFSGLLIPYHYSLSSWNKAWRKLGRLSGVNVNRRGLQSIRRTAASMVARVQGVGTAAQFLGHSAGSGIAVVTRYYLVPGLLDDSPPAPPPLE